MRFIGGDARRFRREYFKRHQRGSHEDRTKIKYQRGIDGDGTAFSGCYEGKLKLGQHASQEIGVGNCHFLEFSKVGASSQGLLRGAGSMPIVK